ncbi:MAG: flagellar hook-length control protein FliK [candidate division Zixibacteria bacterium]|nr:flagellar hook-length control protein FliK [candidate division Zixibacteria bacterium]
MYNAITEPTASPMEMLMGLFAARGEKTPDGSDPFSVLMGLLPLSVPITSAIPVNVPAGDTQPATVVDVPTGKVLLSLSADTMAALGIDPESLPVQGNSDPVSADSQTPMTQIQGELTAAGDGTDGIISLKIQPGLQTTESVQDALSEKGEDQEIIIPMHLRTVEQVGKKVVVTADLLTAAGKDTSVRMQLELSGPLNGNQGMAGTSGEKAGSTLEPQNNGGSGLLPRLLNNLGATLMVIENVETPLPSAMPALLPGAAVTPKKAAVTKTDGAVTRPATVPSTTASPTLQVKVDIAASVETPMKGVVSDEPIDLIRPQVEDGLVSKTETVDPLQVTTGKTSGAEPVAIDPSTGIARSSDTVQETPQVRFHDLDSKLEQLKSNPGQKIRIQLSPANLGKMDLTITSHRGMVTVTLTVDSGQAKEAVQKSLPILESRLAASGIRVNNFQVNATPSSKGTLFPEVHQSFQQNGSAGYGYQRDRNDRQQAYPQPSKQSFGSSDFTFNAAMINCLA